MGRRIHSGLRRPLLRSLITLAIAGVAAAAAGVTFASPVDTGSPLELLVDGKVCGEGERPIPARAVLGKTAGEGSFCFPVGSGGRSTRIDAFYSNVATDVIAYASESTRKANRGDATVICWGESDWNQLGDMFRLHGTDEIAEWFGFVQMPRDVINLSPTICHNLGRIAYSGERSIDEDFARAVTTLAHESMHVAGITGEALAECYAMQLAEFTTVSLGGDQSYGHELALHRVNTYQERFEWTVYATSGCKKSLAHDLGLPNSVLPDSFLSTRKRRDARDSESAQRVASMRYDSYR